MSFLVLFFCFLYSLRNRRHNTKPSEICERLRKRHIFTKSRKDYEIDTFLRNRRNTPKSTHFYEIDTFMRRVGGGQRSIDRRSPFARQASYLLFMLRAMPDGTVWKHSLTGFSFRSLNLATFMATDCLRQSILCVF